MKEKKVIVLLISHKPTLNALEQISLKQCYTILWKYPIKIVCPLGLDISCYKECVSDPQFDFIDPVYLSTYENFNKLKSEPFLYRRYEQYQYILFYELDAFVFRDELDYWCKKGFDYIGAPWLDGFNEANESSIIIGVGNGGFSLRKVSGILDQFKILKRLQVIPTYVKFNWKGFFFSTRKFFQYIFLYNSIKPMYRYENGRQEDNFWCLDMPVLYEEYMKSKSIFAKVFRLFPVRNLNIADIKTALAFSFECQPSRLYKVMNHQLPFGCHAWYRYDIKFWRPFVEKFGYVLPESM